MTFKIRLTGLADVVRWWTPMILDDSRLRSYFPDLPLEEEEAQAWLESLPPEQLKVLWFALDAAVADGGGLEHAEDPEGNVNAPERFEVVAGEGADEGDRYVRTWDVDDELWRGMLENVEFDGGDEVGQVEEDVGYWWIGLRTKSVTASPVRDGRDDDFLDLYSDGTMSRDGTFSQREVDWILPVMRFVLKAMTVDGCIAAFLASIPWQERFIREHTHGWDVLWPVEVLPGWVGFRRYTPDDESGAPTAFACRSGNPHEFLFVETEDPSYGYSLGGVDEDPERGKELRVVLGALAASLSMDLNSMEELESDVSPLVETEPVRAPDSPVAMLEQWKQCPICMRLLASPKCPDHGPLWNAFLSRLSAPVPTQP